MSAERSRQRLQRRRLLAGLAGGLLVPGVLRAQTVDEFGSSELKGAGSTFAHPLMAAWANDYRVFRKGGFDVKLAGGGLDDEIGGVALDYEAVGSQAGLQRLRTRAVDFAVSEMPLPADELRKGGLLQVPLVAGAVAVAFNLEGHSGDLRLTGPVLADIFRGHIQTWADPAIAQLNPGRTLPSVPIAVVHRADGSGTTFTFSTFLARTSPEWQRQLGSDLLINWPVGTGQRGNAGVASALEKTPNSIGYVNLVQTVGTRLALASVQNAAGRFVAPASASVQAALAAAAWDPATQFNTLLVNMPGDGSYPIVAAVFGLASERASGQRQRMTRAFMDWSITQGRARAETLGYTPLPPAAVTLVRAALR